MRKLTIEDCQKVAMSRGGKCLSEEYVGIKNPYKWECKEGHIWESPFDYIKNCGYWCAECAGNKKKDINLCREIAKERRGECLSKHYKNNRTKMTWKCSKGHVWEAVLSKILIGRWCHECGKKRRNIEDCHTLAGQRGGKFLSKEFSLSHSKYLWECANGHEFYMTYGNAKNGNHWCPLCRKLSTEDCHKLAESRGGKFLSEEYINARKKYDWECACGFRWSAAQKQISQGSWCPKCAVGKNQRELSSAIGKIFKNASIIKENLRNFDWLRNPETGYPLEIDILIRHKNKIIAIEYDGEQHFKPIKHFGGQKSFERTQHLDAIKNKLIAEHPEEIDHFIRIPYWEEISEENIRKILQENQIL